MVWKQEKASLSFKLLSQVIRSTHGILKVQGIQGKGISHKPNKKDNKFSTATKIWANNKHLISLETLQRLCSNYKIKLINRVNQTPQTILLHHQHKKSIQESSWKILKLTYTRKTQTNSFPKLQKIIHYQVHFWPILLNKSRAIFKKRILFLMKIARISFRCAGQGNREWNRGLQSLTIQRWLKQTISVGKQWQAIKTFNQKGKQLLV